MMRLSCGMANGWLALGLVAAWSMSASLALSQSGDSPGAEGPREDRVTYGPALPRAVNPWNPPPSTTLVGKIQKLDQQTLEILTSSGESRQLPSDRIERVEVAWSSPQAAAAHARFADHHYTEALKENDEVLRAGGIPKWQQCILLSELVQSAEAIGKPDLAGKLFLLLVQQSPPDYLVATIPLNWTTRELTPALEQAAAGWLAQDDEYAGLLGASWLLLGEQGSVAKQRLQKILASDSKLLQRLAAMQLWRATPPSSTTGELQRWMQARDSLLLPLQLGPTEFLAERLSRIDNPNMAIGEWLRIAASHRDHPYRARLSLEQAQRRLVRGDDDVQAEKVATWLAQWAGQ